MTLSFDIIQTECFFRRARSATDEGGFPKNVAPKRKRIIYRF